MARSINALRVIITCLIVEPVLSNKTAQGTTGTSTGNYPYRTPFILSAVVLVLLATCSIVLRCFVKKLGNARKQLDLQLALAEERGKELISVTEREPPTGSSTTNLLAAKDDVTSSDKQLQPPTATKEVSPNLQRKALTPSTSKIRPASAVVFTKNPTPDTIPRPKSTDIDSAHYAQVAAPTVQLSTASSGDDDTYSRLLSCSKPATSERATIVERQDGDPGDDTYSRLSSCSQFVTPHPKIAHKQEAEPGYASVTASQVETEKAKAKKTQDVYSIPTARLSRALTPDVDSHGRSEPGSGIQEEDVEEEQPVLPPKTYDEDEQEEQ